MTMKRYEALYWASSFLTEKQLEPKVAEILLLHHTKLSRTQFLMELNEPLTEEQQKGFLEHLHQYVAGTPVQYLTGVEKFYGRVFSVNEEVLIPRPETEELVDYMLKKIKQQYGQRPIKAVDIGTGSGIIAITLKLEHPPIIMKASDIAETSLQVARENAKELGADVLFVQGDLLTPFIESGEKFDLIVSNPPYIPSVEIEQLSPYVKNNEPRRALDGGTTGLVFYERLIEQSTKVLNPKGIIAFEIGTGQGEAIKQMLLSTYPESDVAIINDINGKERIVVMENGFSR